MRILLLLVSLPALFWAFRMPGMAGTILVFAVLAALFSGGGQSGPDILGRFGDVEAWKDSSASKSWDNLIRYRDLLAQREVARWGNPALLRLSGWISAALALYSVVFSGILAFALLSHARQMPQVLLWAVYGAMGIAAFLLIFFGVVRYRFWNQRKPFTDTSILDSPDRAATLIREYSDLCAGEAIPGWWSLPFMRLLPALTTAAYHYGLVFSRDWHGDPHGPVYTALSWVVVALMAYYAIPLGQMAVVQWDNLAPHKICPCRFVPLQKLVRTAGLVRNGGKPWLAAWLAKWAGVE